MLCSKSCYAQVCNVLKKQSQLQDMMQATGLLKDGSKSVSNQGLAYVLVYELILGPKQAIQGGGALKRMILNKQDDLRRAAAAWTSEHGEDAGASGRQAARYIRVNTLTTTTKKVVEQIQSILRQASDEKEPISDGSAPVVYLDQHVPDLVVVSPETTSRLLQDTVLSSQSDAVVWQDKSSCFSALCLAEGWPDDRLDDNNDDDYLDACAAPGNKTLHLAALLNAKRQRLTRSKQQNKKSTATTVYALDRSGDRHKVLQQRIRQYCNDGIDKHVKVIAQHQDCLAITPDDYPTVRAIMLDPTCSGSGVITDAVKNAMAHHNEADGDDEADANRVESLSNFQVTCLKHFMSFPKVRRIVYSTCSVHAQENEQVIAQVLDEFDEWTVHAPVCLQQWHRRGQATEGLSKEQTDAMIRVDPYLDGTNGFFVCCLERNGSMDGGRAIALNSNNWVQEMIQGQAEELEIPLYDGEFTTQDNVGVRSADDGSKKSKGKANDRKVPTPAPSGTAPSKADVSTKPKKKKISKKYDWKRQQREAKERRLQKKVGSSAKS